MADVTLCAPNSGVCKQGNAGFSFIELIIALAILGIVLAIAVPAYGLFMTDSRRSDAISFLSEVAGEQQRYFSENSVFASSMGELGYGSDDTAPTPGRHYEVSITTPTPAIRYLLTATPAVDGKQAKDTKCLAFTLSSTGAKKNTGSDSDGCW